MKHFLVRLSMTMAALCLCIALLACNKTTETKSELDAPLQAEGVTLNWQELVMVKGAATTLTYTLQPQDATGTATYTSNNTAVAQVTDQGVVSAVSAGVATITAKVDDTHYAECRVVVGDMVVTAPATAQNGAPNNENGEDDEASGLLSDTADSSETTEGEDAADAGETNGNESGANQTDGNTDDGDTADGSEQNESNAQQSTENANAEQLRRTVVGGATGSTLFGSVQQAVAVARANAHIVVDSGVYNENVTVDKSMTITGLGDPCIRTITVENNAELVLRNVCVAMPNYPQAGEAAVHVKSGAALEMTDCVVTTRTTEPLTGGYGVLAEKQCKKLSIQNCTLSNFRYGVYVRPTDKSVTIKDNTLSNMNTGIGVDVRQENSENNYPTLGEVSGNQYNEVSKHTQFLHYGENYDGDYDFADNEEENASNGQSDAGGSGLLE